jgi:hypothetical protein
MITDAPYAYVDPSMQRDMYLHNEPRTSGILGEITMKDMFDRPEWVKEIKEAESFMDRVYSKIREFHHYNRKIPTYVIISPDLFSNLQRNRVLHEQNVYVPSHMQRKASSPSTFMELSVSVLVGNKENVLEIA